MPDSQEPPIREFADRGTLWLLESPENVRGLLQIVAREIAERLDFMRAQRVNRSFIPDDLQKQEADLLFRVPFREGEGEVWVYVLLEHQSRPDRTMGLRLLSYMVQLWETQRRGWQDDKTPLSQWRLHPVVPIVFYTGKRRWASSLGLSALMEVPALLAEFLPQHRTLFLNLRETPAASLSESAVAWVLRVLKAAEEPREALATVLSEAVTYLETLPDTAQAEWRRALHYLLLLIRHKRKPEEREALYSVVTEAVDSHREAEVREMVMTDAQVLVAQGRREGLKEGRLEGLKEGNLEGRRELLKEQMEFKFGPLPEQIIAAVHALSQSELAEITRRILTAQTLTDLGLDNLPPAESGAAHAKPTHSDDR